MEKNVMWLSVIGDCLFFSIPVSATCQYTEMEKNVMWLSVIGKIFLFFLGGGFWGGNTAWGGPAL